MPDASHLSVSRAQALCVYAEPLVAGRRVVVVGDAGEGLGERLLRLGARSVHVFHASQDGEYAPSLDVRGLTVRELPPGDFDVRDSAFDVALIPDLGSVDERGNLLARVRRLVARGGVALVGAANPGGKSGSARPLDYYELYDRAALHFSYVRMIAQVPFAGVALADLGLEGAVPEVSVDTQLAGESDPPEWFFALASHEEVRLADYAIVQLPVAETADEDTSASDARAHVAIAEAQLRATLLEAQVEDLRAKAQHHAVLSEQTSRVSELELRLGEEAARRRDVEAVLKDTGARLQREIDRANAAEGALRGADAALGALRARASEAEEKLRGREGDLSETRADLERARKAALEAREELTRAEATDARADALAAEVELLSEAHVVDVARLEETLRDRARAVRGLDQEVSRRERIIQELLATLEESKAQPVTGVEMPPSSEHTAALAAANDELRAKLDALAMDIARREGASVESAWRISELEEQIARLEAEQSELTPTMAPPRIPDGASDPKLSERVIDLQGELDVLRQALAQEHEARVRAETDKGRGSADSVDSPRA